MIKNIVNKINSKTSSLCLIDEPLKKHTTYGIGGPAELMIFPKNKKDLINAIQIINDNKMELTILGSGSNVLISDNGIKGAVISLKNTLKNIEVSGNNLYAECGAMLGKIVKLAVKNNLIVCSLSLVLSEVLSNSISTWLEINFLSFENKPINRFLEIF